MATGSRLPAPGSWLRAPGYGFLAAEAGLHEWIFGLSGGEIRPGPRPHPRPTKDQGPNPWV